MSKVRYQIIDSNRLKLREQQIKIESTSSKLKQ
jgi:hypothetical protein